MIIEKAWAKVHGGYMNIAAGLTREALRDLTGASAKTLFTNIKNMNKTESIWLDLIEAEKENFIMTAGSDDLSYGQGDIFISKVGLAGSHAYSLLGVYEVAMRNGVYRRVYLHERNKYQGQTKRLVKLRNPWGKGEWKGKWSDSDKRWNKHL